MFLQLFRIAGLENMHRNAHLKCIIKQKVCCQAQSQLKHSWTELALLSTYTQYGLGYMQHGLGYIQYGLGYIPGQVVGTIERILKPIESN